MKMPNSLIMPKQTARADVFYSSLEIYYNSYRHGEEWVSNEDYKRLIQQLLPDLAQGAQDGAYLVKQSELTRYFGLVYRDYPGRQARITDRGIRFYNAYLNNDRELQQKIIMEAVLNDSFGRNNTAIKSSDSDVDPPKLFLRALHDIGKISINGFAYLLYITNDKEISYNDALVEWHGGEDCEREIPIKLSNKYHDVKFTKFLSELGITVFNDGEYYLSSFTRENFAEKISKLSIYNKEPEIVLTLNAVEIIDGDTEQQEKIITSFAYDINTEAFAKANNRAPEPIKTTKGIKYKTNSRLGKTALQLANYECAYNKTEHKTFTSKLGKPYMEAHHLIPMSAQKDFSINLDRVENIVSLCPVCHSAIHVGTDAVRLDVLTKLYAEREEALKKCGLNISVGELFSKYYK